MGYRGGTRILLVELTGGTSVPLVLPAFIARVLWGARDFSSISQIQRRWWVDRMRWLLSLYDFVRVDHFRGFAACWEIPAGAVTAVNGR
jgi:hypothetical protein